MAKTKWFNIKSKYSANPQWVKIPSGLRENREIPLNALQIDIFQLKGGKNKGKYQVQLWSAKKRKVILHSLLFGRKSEAINRAKKIRAIWG